MMSRDREDAAAGPAATRIATPGIEKTGIEKAGSARPGKMTGLLFAPLLSLAIAATTLTPTPAVAQQDTGSDSSATGSTPADPTIVQPDTSQPDTVQTPVFAAFWQRFHAAVKANDVKALQGMTHLPFDFGGKSWSAAQFPALARKLFDAKTRQCLLRETPLHDQDVYEVFCGEAIYVFGADPLLDPVLANAPDGGGWRLLEIGVND
ncbi:MAG TPA: hypothetical protein VM639_12760 [Dongiaceae bacterium]|nr:hypothetical protein [Dongiaceae bacterium]